MPTLKLVINNPTASTNEEIEKLERHNIRKHLEIEESVSGKVETWPTQNIDVSPEDSYALHMALQSVKLGECIVLNGRVQIYHAGVYDRTLYIEIQSFPGTSISAVPNNKETINHAVLFIQGALQMAACLQPKTYFEQRYARRRT
jgi:hypothetical protein